MSGTLREEWEEVCAERDREKARADAAEAKAESHRQGYIEALERARQSQARAEQAESERDAASEVLRDARAWEAETRGRLGLPQIDAPQWAQIARAALGGGCALDENEQVKRLTAAMREADRAFEDVGGSTLHHVRDCLLPVLKKHGLRLVAALAAPAGGEQTREALP